MKRAGQLTALLGLAAAFILNSVAQEMPRNSRQKWRQLPQKIPSGNAYF